MTNKSVMTFISVNKISVCLSVCHILTSNSPAIHLFIIAYSRVINLKSPPLVFEAHFGQSGLEPLRLTSGFINLLKDMFHVISLL